MDILMKAKELGMMISGSDELKKLQESEIRANQDERATKMLEEYKSKQKEFMNSLRQGEDKEKVDRLRYELKEKQRGLEEYEITRDFLEGKRAFEDLMRSVNNVITHEITGESSCSAGGCASCGRCG